MIARQKGKEIGKWVGSWAFVSSLYPTRFTLLSVHSLPLLTFARPSQSFTCTFWRSGPSLGKEGDRFPLSLTSSFLRRSYVYPQACLRSLCSPSWLGSWVRERRERSLPSFSLISPPHRQGIGNGGERERWPVSLLCSLSSPSGPFTPYRRSTGIERRGDEGMGPVTWLVSRLLPSRHSPLCSRSSHAKPIIHLTLLHWKGLAMGWRNSCPMNDMAKPRERTAPPSYLSHFIRSCTLSLLSTYCVYRN